MNHPDRVRSAPLPKGYQFGDAAPMFPKLRAVADGKTGISIRFVDQFSIEPNQYVHREDTFVEPIDPGANFIPKMGD